MTCVYEYEEKIRYKRKLKWLAERYTTPSIHTQVPPYRHTNCFLNFRFLDMQTFVAIAFLLYRKRTYVQTHTRESIQMHTLGDTHHNRALTLAQNHIFTHKETHTHTRTSKHTHARTHACPHARTVTHTYTESARLRDRPSRRPIPPSLPPLCLPLPPPPCSLRSPHDWARFSKEI